MTRTIGKFALIIALLGQFILTPAMAMPSALMSLMHAGSMEMTQSEMPMPSQSESVMVMSHQGEPCKMSADNELVDCEALCAAMGPGDCMTHCASTLGHLNTLVPALNIPAPSGPIVTSAWSLQTAELTPLSPPPIG